MALIKKLRKAVSDLDFEVIIMINLYFLILIRYHFPPKNNNYFEGNVFGKNL